MRRSLFFLAAVASLVGCGGQQSGMDIRNNGGLSLNSNRSAPTRQTPAEERATEKLNVFSMKLVRSVFGEGKANTAVAPIGAIQGLQVLDEATEGATQDEIKKALKEVQGARVTGTAFGSSLWSPEGISAPAKETKAAVSSWQTEGKLQEWFKEALGEPVSLSHLDEAKQLVLLNAGRIPSALETPFDSSLTKPLAFKSPAGDLDIPFLHGAGSWRFFAAADTSVLELPLAEARLAIRLIVPTGEKTLKDLLKDLNDKNWAHWSRSLIEQPVDLAMPKLRMEFQTVLDQHLAKVGISKVFAANAGFGKLATSPLHVGEARQVLALEFSEGAPSGEAPKVLPSNQKPLRLVVDRPFLAFLVDRDTSAIAAAALIVRPEWQEREKNEKAIPASAGK